jgi:hypothetical protein
MFGVLCAASAQAQTCTGQVPLASAHMQAGVQAAFTSNSHSFAPGVTYAKDNYFGRGAVEVMSFSGIDASAKGFLGQGGAEYAVNAGTRALSVCPLVTLAKTWGPSVEDGFDQSSWLLGFGGSVGFVATKTGTTTVVPTFGVSINRLSTKSTGNFAFNTNSFTSSSSFGDAQFGVGLLFNDHMALVPSLVVPFGLDGAETGFSVLFSTRIGK